MEEQEQDIDQDGYTNVEDCDDYNPDVFPNQFEVCDGLDNNCNEEIDEGVLNYSGGCTYYHIALDIILLVTIKVLKINYY